MAKVSPERTKERQKQYGLSQTEAAALLGINAITFSSMVNRGKLPAPDTRLVKQCFYSPTRLREVFIKVNELREKKITRL